MSMSSNPFWSLFNALPVGAVLFDPADDGFVEFNDSACVQLGYTREQFARLKVGDIDTLRSGLEIAAARRLLAPGGAPQRFRTRQRAANGYLRDVDVLVQSIVLDGRQLGYAVWQDVTEQELALARLRAREVELQRVQQIGRVGGFEIDLRNGFDNQRSPEYLRLHNLPADASNEPHEAWVQRLHPLDRERTDRFFRDTVAGSGRDYAAEYRVVTPEGETRWISAVAEIERDRDGRPLRMVGAHIDITALKQVESALAEHATRLQMADRRKDEFLAMLGHELRNPMAAMLSVTDLLARYEAGLPGPVLHAHQVLNRHLGQLRVLVDELLDVARIQTGKIVISRQVIDMCLTVRAALEQTNEIMVGNRHRCEVSLPDHPVWVSGDATRLVQVIANLLNNAAKYTDPGGLIQLAVRIEHQQVCIEVRDSGIGIAADLLPHVFELFVQAGRAIDRSIGGLGIGLTLAKEVIAQHGGSITARSEGPGRGSCFEVRLPEVQAPAPSGILPVETAKADRLHRRILVVDDNVDAAETMAMLLALEGHEVTTLHDGNNVLQHVRRHRPQVALLDLGLPGKTGFEVADELRRDPDGCQVVLVALTGYGQEADRRKSQEHGFMRHFVKPVEVERLLSFLATLPAP